MKANKQMVAFSFKGFFSFFPSFLDGCHMVLARVSLLLMLLMLLLLLNLEEK